MDAKKIQERLSAYARERGWDEFDSPKSLAMAMAGEVGTLLSIFQWLSGEEARAVAKSERREVVADALADVVLYALRLADKADIDFERTVDHRLASRYALAVPAARESAPAPAESEASAPVAPPASAPQPEAEPERVETRLDAAAIVEPPPPVDGLHAASVRADPPATASAPIEARAAASSRDEVANAEQDAAGPEPAAEEEDEGETLVLDLGNETAPAAREATPPATKPSKGGATAERPVHPKLAAPASAARPPAKPAARAHTTPRPAPKAAPAPAVAAAPASPTPEPVAAPPVAPAPPKPVAPPEPVVEAEAALDFARALVRALDRLSRDDPILRDLRDEVETLRRVVYSASSKPAWIVGSLRSLHALLEEANAHSFADDIRVPDLIRQVDRLLSV